MDAYLLRVGIDLGYGALGPIFEDNTFDYIPIPELEPTRESRTFSDIESRHKGNLSDYLPRKLHMQPPHYDPEFISNTYGDPSSKAKQLRKLKKDDLLVFYAGLMPWKHHREINKGLYLIGYLCVESIFDFKIITQQNRAISNKLLMENAHIKQIHPAWDTLIIVKGSMDSALLELAILISQDGIDKRGRRLSIASNKFESLTGVKGSLQRSLPPRWVRGTRQVNNLWRLLDEGFD